MNAWQIYNGSNGAATRQLYERLEAHGMAGLVAINLFRAQKASSRAKVYRGGGFKGKAYEKKEWSLKNLCAALEEVAVGDWGWKEDATQAVHRWVLYVELPTGQVSFHAARALCDRRFPGEWDGSKLSAERICRFVQLVLNASEAAPAQVLRNLPKSKN